ncbi:MAG: hypothetical protein ABSC89_00015 [Verrucomicrobiota bacterium]|jgi:hypothetical protein
MSELKPELEGIYVVLIGSFNPQIFQPLWFSKEGLIQEPEAQKAEVQVIAPEAAVFSIGWMQLEVTHERFAATTNQPQYFDALRDLVLGVFKLLRHTPIKHLGINKLEHFRSSSEKEWHRIGHLLAPKEPWKGLLEEPGMRKVQMLGIRSDGFRGRISVTVEPSVKVKPGVFFGVNDHFEIEESEDVRSCERMVEILGKAWQDSLARAEKITRGIMKI